MLRFIVPYHPLLGLAAAISYILHRGWRGGVGAGVNNQGQISWCPNKIIGGGAFIKDSMIQNFSCLFPTEMF